MTLANRVRDFSDRHALLEPGQRLLVGVSGGADSLCLLHVLLELGCSPVVAHYDHRARAGSGAEAHFVFEHCRALGLPVELGAASGEETDPPAAGEAAWREARYRFLFKAAAGHGLDTVATGHTADDQAETVLMNLLRGSGAGGLRGMLPATRVTEWPGLEDGVELRLVRPLLGEPHAVALAYCAEHGLEYLQDPSNADPGFTRNRIRHELIPTLERYNPRIRDALNRLAEIMRVEVDWLEQQLDQVYDELLSSSGPGSITISVGSFAAQPQALQRAALRRLMQRLDRRHEPGLDAIERLREFVLDPARPSGLQVSGALRALDAGAQVRIRRTPLEVSPGRYPQAGADEEIALPVPGEVELPGGWRLCSRIEPPEADRENWLCRGWPNRVVFSTDAAPAALAIRTRRPGDALRQFGSGGRHKLSDLMIDRKIPRAARARWPLVTAGEEIIWVPGLARSDFAVVSVATQRGLVLELVPPLHSPFDS